MSFNIKDIMSKAKEMKSQMDETKAELARTEVIGESGAGMVQVKINGNHVVSEVIIRDDAMEDKSVLQDLIRAALNDAERKILELTKSKFQDIGSMIGLDGMSDEVF